jgi:hypothetical protein
VRAAFFVYPTSSPRDRALHLAALVTMTAPTTHQDQGSWVALRASLPLAPSGAPESPLALPTVSKQKDRRSMVTQERASTLWLTTGSRSVRGVACQSEPPDSFAPARRSAPFSTPGGAVVHAPYYEHTTRRREGLLDDSQVCGCCG